MNRAIYLQLLFGKKPITAVYDPHYTAQAILKDYLKGAIPREWTIDFLLMVKDMAQANMFPETAPPLEKDDEMAVNPYEYSQYIAAVCDAAAGILFYHGDAPDQIPQASFNMKLLFKKQRGEIPYDKLWRQTALALCYEPGLYDLSAWLEDLEDAPATMQPCEEFYGLAKLNKLSAHNLVCSIAFLILLGAEEA